MNCVGGGFMRSEQTNSITRNMSTSECYVDDMQARLMGTNPPKKLKPGSVPTVFSFLPNLGSELPSRSELRIQSKERQGRYMLGYASLRMVGYGDQTKIVAVSIHGLHLAL